MMYFTFILCCCVIAIIAFIVGKNSCKQPIQKKYCDVVDRNAMIIVYDEFQKLIEVQNPIDSVLMGVDVNQMRGASVRQMISLASKENRYNAEIVVENIIAISEAGGNRYFEYLSLNNGQPQYVLCYVYKMGKRTYSSSMLIDKENPAPLDYSKMSPLVNVCVRSGAQGCDAACLNSANTKLRTAIASMELVVEAANESIWEYDIEKDVFVTLYGNAHPAEGMSLNESALLLVDAERKKYLNLMRSMIAAEQKKGKCVINTSETDYVSEKFYEMTMLFMPAENGSAKRIIGAHKDVTTQINEKSKQESLANRYFTIFNSIDMGIGVRDVDGRLLEYNTKFMEYYGVADVDEFLAYNTAMNMNIIPKMIFDAYKDRRAGSFITSYDFDKTPYKSNRIGTATYEVKVAPMTDDKGRNCGFVILITDITEKYMAELEIAQARENLVLALNAGSVSAWSYDVKQKIFYTLSGDAIAGQGLSMEQNMAILHPDDAEVQREIFAELSSGQATEKQAVFRYNSDGNGYRYYQSQMIVKKDVNGNVTHVMGTQKDLTDDIRQKTLLNAKNRENELILQNINSGLVYLDKDFTVLWENLGKFFNIPDDVENRPYKAGVACYKSLKERSEPCENCLVLRSLASGKSEFEQEVVNDGCQVEICAIPIKDENNVLEGAILRLDEITERNRLLHEIEESKNRAEEANKLMSNIFDKLPCMLFVKDISDDYRFLIANDHLCNATGFKAKDVIGYTDFDIFPKADAEFFRREDMKAVANDGAYVYEEEVLWNGRRYIWQTTKYTMDAVNGHKLMIGLSLDMTEKIDAYKDLEIAKEHAEESDRLKSSFIANMSHEIRTPLNAIVGFSDLLQSEDDPQAREEYVRIINTNNELLLRLINDILDLSRIESQSVKMKCELFDLVPMFAEYAISLRQKIKNPEVELIEVNPYQKCIVNLDKFRVAQVFTNFVTNAIKFTKLGYIKMGYEHCDNGIKFYVEDTGVGIPEDKQGVVFHRFEKVNEFTQGTGLGLPICEAIVKANGGKIGFESKEGEGSTFWAWFECDVKIS